MNPERKKFLEELKGRSALLFPEAREQLSQFITKAEASNTEENIKALINLKREAMSDSAKLQDFNRRRVLVVENLVTAKSNAGAFFRKVTLAEDEEPWLENSTGIQTKARFIGEDGKPHMTQVMKTLSRMPIPLGYVSTRELEYPLVDVYRGRVGQDILNAVPLADAIVRATDRELWKLIRALPMATFKTTGPEHSRTFVLDENIVAANVPVGNVIDVRANGKFNFETIKAIVKFYIQFGEIFGEDITPQVIYVPSLDASNFIDDITFTTANNNPAVQQVFEKGWVTEVAGKRITIVGDPTLDPALGEAFIRTNQPIGEWYTKPSLDINYPENTAQIPTDWIRENKGRTFMKKIFGAATPMPWTIRMAKVRYKNPS